MRWKSQELLEKREGIEKPHIKQINSVNALLEGKRKVSVNQLLISSEHADQLKPWLKTSERSSEPKLVLATAITDGTKITLLSTKEQPLRTFHQDILVHLVKMR